MHRSTWFSRLLVVGMASFACSAEAADTPALKCDVGPVLRQYGATDWLVFSCSDKSSVVFVTAPGSPATPFVFSYLHTANGYELHGEGNGNKALTDAAFKDLKGLSPAQIVSLLVETQKVLPNTGH